jgi:CheY-like chemotaxis protein
MYFPPENVEVVITDIILSGMDGLTLTDRIKRNHEAT